LNRGSSGHQLAEKCELLRRLWREENVTWTGTFRSPLQDATTLPRPFAGAPRVWPGSATTQTSAALAGRWGDPLFSANAIQPRENYKVLIDHYRAEYARHGHGSRYAYVAAGAGFLFLADTTQQAREYFGPIYEKMVAFFNLPGNHTPGNEMTFREAPTTLWTDQDPYGRCPACTGRQVPAAAIIDSSTTDHVPADVSFPPAPGR
jgi:alkanesulfonate monooxygenase SsuD/methylene tetrahydromethanopterin reductase-like flavin-dependent oxidoreductase (luciferase family)